ARRDHRSAEPRVHGGGGGAELGCDRDFPGQVAEQLRLLGILPPLSVHDVLELGMAGHCWVSRFVRREGWKARRYRPRNQQNQRFLRLFGALAEGLGSSQALLTMTSCTDERMRREFQSTRAAHGVRPVSKASSGIGRACRAISGRAEGYGYPH